MKNIYLLYLFLSISLFGKTDYKCKSKSTSDGLSNSVINYITHDTYINIWIALNHCDGDGFDVLRSASKANSISLTSLGLFMCKEFIEKNRDEIKVESTNNKGSILSIFIPIN